MKSETINIWKTEEYTYEAAFGFIPNLVSYIHEEDEVQRPCIIVVPGGGYCVVSPTEGEIVAKDFYKRGYNTFVLTYTTNLLMNTPLKKQPMQDLSRAIRFVRKNAEDYHVNPNQLIFCGFSAGAHACGSVCVHYEDISDPDKEYEKISNRPDAAILSYPVITAGEKAHRGSFIALLGTDASQEELDYMSLEKQVTKQTPPCFLWQTVTDETVPVENSYLFAEACRKHGVNYAFHVFSKGRHGLSLANEDWANGRFGYPYTLKQNIKIIEMMKANNIPIPEELAMVEKASEAECNPKNMQVQTGAKTGPAMPEVMVWPIIADAWLKTINVL